MHGENLKLKTNKLNKYAVDRTKDYWLKKILMSDKNQRQGKAYVAKQSIGAAFWSKSKFTVHFSKINSSIFDSIFLDQHTRANKPSPRW